MSVKTKVYHSRAKMILSWIGITSDRILGLWKFLKPYFTGLVLIIIGMLIVIDTVLGVPEYQYLKETRKTVIGLDNSEDVGVMGAPVAFASTEYRTEPEDEDKIVSNTPPVSEIRKTIERIAKEEGVDPKMVISIGILESALGKKMEGDNGLSKGWYHIYYVNTCEYKKTATCINSEDRMDLEKSTRWTAKRLKAHEVLGEHEQIRSHNGLIADHSNDGYVAHVEMLMAGLK